MNSNRPLFASWLIEQVETGQYKGLRYVDRNHFRVPWKHNSRKDCSDEDSKIFKAWAVCSGKIIDYPNDKAKWKTNFRCTLNNLTKRFKMIEDNSKNAEDPHKIYEIINNEYDYEGARADPTPDDDDSDMIPDIYCSPVDEFPAEHDDLLNHLLDLDLNNHAGGEQPLAENYGMQAPGSYPDHPPPQVMESLPVSHPPGNHPGPEPSQPYYGANPGAELMMPHQPNIFDLEISIHYRGKLMFMQQVSGSRLQLHYNHPVPDLNAHTLCFPSTESLLDHKQIDYTNRILNNIQNGLILEVQNNGIYASRLGSCHVFASTKDPREAQPNPKTLPKNCLVELLSFEHFLNELRLFHENKRSSPDYTIQMCFGEKFPDGKPPERKLVVVKVVPLICRHFHEMAQADGASSLLSDNVSLQISNSLFDLISAFIAASDLPQSPPAVVF